MEPYRDDDLTAALSALRPAPRPAFAAELDARVAAGFPRESRLRAPSLDGLKERLRNLKPRQVLLPAGAFAITAIVVATAVVSSGGSDSEMQLSMRLPEERLSAPTESSAPGSGVGAAGSGGGQSSTGNDSAGPQYETEVPAVTTGAAEEYSAGGSGSANGAADAGNASAFDATHRAVERSAEITLGTEPAEVGDAAAKVFDVVHANRGVVLSSSTSDGSAGEASAEFELLIPSAKLGDAMAAFSGIAEVRSRHEATDDITAPTVSASEHLQDSQARIDSLLAQLAEAETEGEREAVEAELASERRRASGLRASLQNLERRANLSRVELRIESDEAGAAPDAGGSWGVGDALGDAGRILAVGAAVSLVGLAIVGPLALIALLAWLAHRAWIHRARRQALG
ncbi:MAG: DUF4349 domain-containing protein [Solirubrobacterales bacterium]